MDRSQMASLRNLLAQAQALGIKLPKPISTAQATLEKIRAGAAAIPPHDLSGVANAVADSLARDADPVTDPAVAKAIALSVITSSAVVNNIEAVGMERLAQSCADHADDIVIAMRIPFDAAAAVLVTSHKQIGDVDLKDSAAILRQGGNVASVWADAVTASKAIDAIIVAWHSLSQIIRPEQADRRWVALRMIDASAEVYDRLNASGVAVTPWEAVCGGAKLSLPTLSEYTERRAAITAERAEIQEAASRGPKRPSYL
ncbi:MAG: hypothetical protein WA090_09405 [Candidatus Nanopelagicaceae bacterium]